MANGRLLRMLVLAGLVAAGTIALSASDHRDGPLIHPTPTLLLDLNDLYVFKGHLQSPTTVFILTMNPMAGLVESTTFPSNAMYELLVDTDGEPAPNRVFRITFSQQTQTGLQYLTLTSESGAVRARGPVGPPLPIEGGGTLLAGVFDDPFFFDMIAF